MSYTDTPLPSELGLKRNTFNSRTYNKKALAKKKRSKERSAGLLSTSKIQIDSSLISEVDHDHHNTKTGIVLHIAYRGNHPAISVQDFITNGTVVINSSRIHDLVIGDRVIYDSNDEKTRLIRRENRDNELFRFRWDHNRFSLAGRERHILAANIDCALIIASAKDPDFHPQFIDRYLILCDLCKIQPLILITKTDLEKPTHPTLATYREVLHIPVIEVSAVQNEGFDILRNHIRGKTCILVGRSGVGKSTVTNTLLGKDIILTKTIGKKTHLGRHTTTSSSAYEWDKQSFIIDTPGIRALDLFEIGRSEIKDFFPEFSNYSTSCEFRDCSHTHESNCWVKKAVQMNQIDPERFASYKRILDEAA